MPEVNTAGGAFPEETPAFNEQDQAILDGQDPQELEQEGELIGGKFRSADDLLQAYQELERKLGQQDEPEIEPYYEEDPNIEGVQVPEDAVEQSLPAAEEATILETIGGAENLTTIREWAQAELDQDEIDSYNEEVNSGDYTRARNAVQSMFFAYNQAVGQEPNLLGGRISNNATDVYRSVQEVEAAMNDPRYLHDTAYTQDVEENTVKRDEAIAAEHIKYGPLNIDEPGDYWVNIANKWDTSVEAAKKSRCYNCVAFDISPQMKECMPGEVDKDGELGYCWMHHFKCHSARTCNTWAKGGPIDDDNTSSSWDNKNK